MKDDFKSFKDEIRVEPKALRSKIEPISLMVPTYNEMVREYRSDLEKHEILRLQIEEVARLEEEYRHKLELLPETPLDASVADVKCLL